MCLPRQQWAVGWRGFFGVLEQEPFDPKHFEVIEAALFVEDAFDEQIFFFFFAVEPNCLPIWVVEFEF